MVTEINKPIAVVADDLLIMKKIVSMVFEEVGYDVRAVDDGAQALALLESLKADGLTPEVICMDNHMPHMEGKDVLAAAIVTENKDALKLMITGVGVEAGESPKKFKERVMGMNDSGLCDTVITKPFEPRQLKEQILELAAAKKEQNAARKLTEGQTVTHEARVVYTIPPEVAREAGIPAVIRGEKPLPTRAGDGVIGDHTQNLSNRRTSPKQPRVFIITDNNAPASNMLGKLYTAEGYDVTAVNNHRDCEAAMNNGYDLVVFGGGKFDGEYGSAANLMVSSSQRGHALADTPKLAYMGLGVEKAKATLADNGLNPDDAISKPAGQRDLMRRSNEYTNHEGKGIALLF